MKIRYSIIMILYILPYKCCPFSITIKCSIHKFNLWNLFIQKYLQLFLNKLNTSVPHLFVNGRKAVTT